MRKITIFWILLFSINVFAEGAEIPFKNLDGFKDIKRSDWEEHCYSSVSRKQYCVKSRECVRREFRPIVNTQTYFSLEESTQVEYFREKEEKDRKPALCYGEPDAQKLKIYNKTNLGYTEVGTIESGGCFLNADIMSELNGVEILKITCSFTGTGHVVDETFYQVSSNSLKKIDFSEEDIELPSLPEGVALSQKQFEFVDDHIRLRYWAQQHYCRCVAAFSVDLALTKNKNEGYSLTYIDGSYRPQFTSLSNARNRSGLEHYRQGNYSEAIREFEQAQKLDVLNYEAITNLGLAHLRAGNLNRSIRYSMMVFNLADGKLKANAAYNLGNAYEKQGNLQQSLKFYRAANSAAPSSARKSAVERVQALMDTQSP